ncbi:MAG: SulP family inorganic anion transporter [Acidobacteria bacterium]|nr:SulP family inorganic anion transporter [Acidobacteriota bacterium]
MTESVAKRSLAPSTFGADMLASIVVVLVALPLCMGIAIASGLPPALGLVTGIIGGVLVGSIAGSPLQVSGPAAGLAVIVYEIVQEHGLDTFGIIILLAGIIQAGAGLLRFGQWFRAVSPAVINGMLAGIGILIFSSQFHVMVDDKPRSSGIANLISIPESVWKGISPLDGSTHHLAAAIGVLTIIVILFWNTFAKKIKMVPAPLVAVITAVIVAAVMKLDVKYVQIPGSFLDILNVPSLESVKSITHFPIFLASVSVAFIASAETLLSASAVDKMHSGVRTNYDRELFAQGIGNAICGMLGALPMTGVIVRSAANVEAGAKTRLSTILHGIWLLVFVLCFPWLLEKIPTASLAAILVFTGYKLVNPTKMKEILTYGRSEFAIYLVTVIAIVATNLLEGVLIGLGMSIAKLIYVFTHLDSRLEVTDGGKHARLTMRGSATFIMLPKLAALLDQVPPGAELQVHFESLDYIDHACLDLLMDWEKQHESTGGEMCIEWDELEAKFHRRRPEWSKTPDRVAKSESDPDKELAVNK